MALCLETIAYAEERRPLKKCDSSSSSCGCHAAVPSTNHEAKHFPGISLITFVVIVTQTTDRAVLFVAASFKGGNVRFLRSQSRDDRLLQLSVKLR